MLNRELFSRLREEVLAETKSIVSGLASAPSLAILYAGDDPASEVYMRNKVRTCRSVGIDTECIRADTLPALQTAIIKARKEHTAVILQLPLPNELASHTRELLDLIPWYKDADGLTQDSHGRLWTGEFCLKPATAEAVCRVLDHFHNDYTGKSVLVINRSDLIGKPLIKMLLDRNASVTVAHSHSNKDWLKEQIYRTDWLVTGMGVCDMDIVRAYAHAPHAAWIDCGIIRKGKCIHGDAGAFEADWLSPVPGGVGTLTTACLALNVAKAARYYDTMWKLQYGDI